MEGFISAQIISSLRKLSILLHFCEACQLSLLWILWVTSGDSSFKINRICKDKTQQFCIFGSSPAEQVQDKYMLAVLYQCQFKSEKWLSIIFELMSLFPYSEEKQSKNEPEPFRELDSLDSERTLFLSKEEDR